MRYDPIRTIERRAVSNLGLCTVAGCNRVRHGVSELCLSHLRARKRHGHPKGRNVCAHFYSRELREAARYVATDESPELRSVLAHTAAWLRDARLGQSVPAAREMARLARYGVEPAALVAEWLALIVYARRNPQSLPDDARLTFALANRVVRLAPRDVVRTELRKDYAHGPRTQRIYALAPKSEREALGTYVRGSHPRPSPYPRFLHRAAAELCARLNQPSAT